MSRPDRLVVTVCALGIVKAATNGRVSDAAATAPVPANHDAADDRTVVRM